MPFRRAGLLLGLQPEVAPYLGEEPLEVGLTSQHQKAEVEVVTALP